MLPSMVFFLTIPLHRYPSNQTAEAVV
jgi:hypothetical protein